MSPAVISRDPFLSEVEQSLRHVIFAGLSEKSLSPTLVEPTQFEQLTTPPDFRLGQAAFATHFLSKHLRLPPAKIGEFLKERLDALPRTQIAKVDAVNGYLNFHVRLETYGHRLLAKIKSGEFFIGPWLEPEKIEKILVEFAQPNTHKALHVGHLRNVVYGEAVCSGLAAIGHQVVRATYPGDMGAHIAKLLYYISNFHPEKIATGNADWLGEMYADSDDYVKSVEGSAEEPRVKNGITEVLHQMQNRSGPFYELYLKTREWSLEQMREVYAWLGITFDKWFYESECDGPSRELVLKKLKEGFFQKSQGAVGLDLSAYNLGFAMFLKSDGTGLYLTKDLELIRQKFLDPKVTRSIVVVDARQRLHFQQLFKTAELMGYPQAAKSVHLSYESVTTEDGKAFSSRSKNGLPLDRMRRLMEERITHEYLSGYVNEWPAQEIEDTARRIALGALKYGLLRIDANNQIKFVLADWLKLDGDTGPYLQYSYARLMRVLEKVGRPGALTEFVYEYPVEAELLMFLSRYHQFVLAAGSEYRPSVLAGYLYDLCKLINRFYHDCSIKDGDAKYRDSRLALVEGASGVLAHGLGLLGIPTVARM